MPTYSLTLRQDIGRRLTISEMDNNFLFLQDLTSNDIVSNQILIGAGIGQSATSSNTFTYDKTNRIFKVGVGHTIPSSSIDSLILGGSSNILSGGSYKSSIIGGDSNFLTASDYASIIGGNSNSAIGSPRSVILGGSNLTLDEESDLVFVPELKIDSASNDDSLTKILVWDDESTKKVKFRNVNTISGGEGGGSQGPQGPTGNGMTEVTYSELDTIISSASLTPGSYYLITDFKTCYDQPIYNQSKSAVTSGNYKVGNTHSIIVMAISSTALSVDAYQPDYPMDKIKYDFNYSSTFVTSGTAFGRISERIDEWGNRTDYDHREVLFRRYKYYYYNTPPLGEITLSSGGSATGSGTQFDVDFSVDDYIILPNVNQYVFKITQITSSQSMSVTGSSIPDTTSLYYKGNQTISGNLNDYVQYYPNNVDGQEDYLEFHTFKLENETIVNNKFGDFYSLINWNEPYFDLPNNVFGEDVLSSSFGDYFVNNTFVNDVEETTVGDYCENNFYYADDNDFANNVIGNNFRNNIIFDSFRDNFIGNDFYDNYITSNFRRNNTSFNFNNNIIDGDFDDNNIGNGFVENVIYRRFTNNTIRNGFNNNDIYDDFDDNFIDNGFENNTIGSANSIGNYDFEGNKIGYDSKGNFFRGYVYDNILGHGFYSNDVHGDFNGNVFGMVCVFNTFGTNSQNNNIGNFFISNDIGEYFSDNHIQNYFQDNNISYDFSDNHIQNYFQDNDISYNFSKNHIQNSFQDNNISYNFSFNEIGNRFSFNNIENDFGFGGAQSRGNKIGNYFQYNTIGEYFYDNTIVDYFDNNEVGNDFQMNDVKVRNLYNYNFIQYQGNIVTFTYQSSGTTSTPGFYNILSGTTSGHGESASFGITVSGGTISDVSLVSAGYQYVAGDTISISGTQIGGVSRAIATFSINSLSVKIYKPADSTYEFPSDETEMDYLIDNSPLFDTYYSSNIQGVSYTTKVGTNQSDYAMVIEGYIQIPSSNTYSFGLSSDDGSDAFVNGIKVADWYGAHEDSGPSGNFYPIFLTTGRYPIKVRLQERSGGDIVRLQYSLDGVSWNIIPNNWFTPDITGITGSYPGIFATGGTGEGATFDVEVIGGLVDSVVLSNGGGSYSVGNVLTIPGSEFGGTQSVIITVDSVYSDDVTITVTAVSATPSVYEYYNTTIFMNGGGNLRLSYYDGDDVLTIKNITE
jgi:hypothetical protein